MGTVVSYVLPFGFPQEAQQEHPQEERWNPDDPEEDEEFLEEHPREERLQECLHEVTSRPVLSLQTRISEHIEGLSLIESMDSVLKTEYVRFMTLKAIVNDVSSTPLLSPSGPVDRVWHEHLLHPIEYFRMSTDVFKLETPLFHDPSTASSSDKEHRYARTLQLYRGVFGIDPPVYVWENAANTQKRRFSVYFPVKNVHVKIPLERENNRVHDLMKAIATLFPEFPVHRQILSSEGRRLVHNDILHGLYGEILVSVKDYSSWSLFIKNLAGKIVTLKVSGRESVLELKQMLEEKEAIPVNHQVLIFAKKELKNGFLLEDYDVQNGDTIYMLIR